MDEQPQNLPTELTRARRKTPHFLVIAGVPPQARVLTVREVAEVLRIGRNTAYALIHDGELHAIKCRNSFRVPRSEFERYLRGEAS